MVFLERILFNILCTRRPMCGLQDLINKVEATDKVTWTSWFNNLSLNNNQNNGRDYTTKADLL